MHNDALDEVVISLPIVDTTARSCYIFNEFRVSTCGSFSLIDKFQGHFRWNWFSFHRVLLTFMRISLPYFVFLHFLLTLIILRILLLYSSFWWTTLSFYSCFLGAFSYFIYLASRFCEIISPLSSVGLFLEDHKDYYEVSLPPLATSIAIFLV